MENTNPSQNSNMTLSSESDGQMTEIIRSINLDELLKNNGSCIKHTKVNVGDRGKKGTESNIIDMGVILGTKRERNIDPDDTKDGTIVKKIKTMVTPDKQGVASAVVKIKTSQDAKEETESTSSYWGSFPDEWIPDEKEYLGESIDQGDIACSSSSNLQNKKEGDEVDWFEGKLQTIRNLKYDPHLKGHNLSLNVDILNQEEIYFRCHQYKSKTPKELINMRNDVEFAKKCFYESTKNRLSQIAKVESMKKNKRSQNPYCSEYVKLKNEEEVIHGYDGLIAKNSQGLNRILDEYLHSLKKWTMVKW